MKTFEIFNKIKEAKGSKAKLKIASEEFTSREHDFMEVCYNYVVYGISGKGIEKAIGYLPHLFGAKKEDLGDWIKSFILTGHHSFKALSGKLTIKQLAEELPACSGNAQIERLKEMLNFFELDELPWVIRAIQGNMRIGFSLTSYNKLRAKLNMTEIKGFEVQLCGKLEVSRENFEKLSYPRIGEFKYDGIRCIITILKGQVTLQARSGNDITERYPEVVNMLETKFSNAETVTFDSEIISSSFIKLSTRMHRKAENIEEHDDSLHPVIFDVLSYKDVSMKNHKQIDRRTFLELLAKDYDLELSYIEIKENVDDLLQFYKDARAIEQEGVVTKDMDMKWVEGSRDGWTKMVPKETLDLKIVEGYYGTGKNHKFISGVIVENAAGTIRSKASSGVTDEYREILTDLHNKDELVGKIAEINYREISKSKNEVDSLRFPVFRRIRDDKLISD